MGSPLHQAGLLVTAVFESVNRPGSAGSTIVFETMPWRAGRRPGDQGVVIRKRQARMDRDEAVGPHTARRQGGQRRRVQRVQVVPAPPVEGHEDDNRPAGGREAHSPDTPQASGS